MEIDLAVILIISSLAVLATLLVDIMLVYKKRFKLKILLLNVFVIIAALAVPTIFYLTTTPKIISSIPNTEGVWASYHEPVRVFFNMPVDASRLNATINPEIKGNFVWKPYLGIARLTKEGIFIPEESLFPNQRIVIYITGIGRLGMRQEGHEYGIVFETVKLPEIEELNIEDNEKEIGQDEELKIKFNKPLDGNADLAYKFTPETDFDINTISDREIILKPRNNLQLSMKYTFTVERRPKRINLTTSELLEYDNFEIIHQIDFETQKEPLIQNYSPKGKEVKSDAKILILFFADMNQESVENNFKIEPAIKGSFEWRNSRTLMYVPTEELPKETEVKVTLAKDIMSVSGVKAKEDIFIEFETIGAVRVADFSPSDGQIRVGENSSIKVRFNQEVDQPSAEKKFIIQPEVNGIFSWEENVMSFKPSTSYSFNTTYTISILAGVKSIFGLNSKKEFSSKFTVRSNEVIITMPWYPQPQYPVSFSCNIYAAKMALAWKGYNLSATSIIAELGYDQSKDSQGRWLANPHQKYVGNADGFYGYGVYWEPVQQLFTNRGITTELHQNWNIRDVARSVSNGRPVVIWRYNGTSQDKNIEWGTSGVHAINGQHGGVITGFRGTIDNPTSFYINDPWFGLIWMNVNSFDYYWSRLNRVGLVIY